MLHTSDIGPFTIAVGLAACGATAEPITTPAKVAVPVVEVPAEAEGEGVAPSSIDEPVGALRFVRSLCEAATTGDDELVRASVALPLSGQEHLSNSGPLRVAGIFTDEQPRSVADRAMCNATSGAFDAIEIDANRARAILAVDGQRYRLTFERHPPRLIEQTLLVDDVPLPPRRPTERGTEIVVQPRSDTGPAVEELAAAAKRQLLREPHCIEAQAASPSPTSGSFQLTVTTGSAPRMQLLASTVVPATFLGCLQAQLRPTLVEAARAHGPEVDHELWLMIGIEVAADEGVDGIGVGPKR